uniref:SFRICE_019970 n=1 Tax=Spodoptera frugiperda TaxID=7108 RepID=A0A2H1VFF4_SPOFR
MWPLLTKVLFSQETKLLHTVLS